jgi:hypothetical protein
VQSCVDDERAVRCLPGRPVIFGLDDLSNACIPALKGRNILAQGEAQRNPGTWDNLVRRTLKGCHIVHYTYAYIASRPVRDGAISTPLKQRTLKGCHIVHLLPHIPFIEFYLIPAKE